MRKDLFTALLLVFVFPFISSADEQCRYGCTENEKRLTESVVGHKVLFQYRDDDGNWKEYEAGSNEWSTTDTVAEIATAAVLYCDWRQTREIAKHPVLADGRPLSEGNPLLPRHPSVSRVNNSFMVTAVLHPLISYVLPRPLREGWQIVFLAGDGVAVIHNYNIGLGPRVKGKMGG